MPAVIADAEQPSVSPASDRMCQADIRIVRNRNIRVAKGGKVRSQRQSTNLLQIHVLISQSGSRPEPGISPGTYALVLLDSVLPDRGARSSDPQPFG